ncbi:MAG: 4Fe-4S dicluster domain-containing protein [Chloroflexi bacterium]|nr:4Fe-4S dicluster domain-containing protein [Chloroflexota bacterium]
MILQVNPEKCTGCSACEAFCSLEQERVVNPALARIHVFKDEPRDLFLPIVCPPCDEKLCIAACPEPGGIVVSEMGAVVIVEHLCTGCSKCVSACDIGAIRLVRQSGHGKFGKAVAVKCDQCGGDPWCVRVCVPGALEYVLESHGQMVFEKLRAALPHAEKILAERGALPRRRIATK